MTTDDSTFYARTEAIEKSFRNIGLHLAQSQWLHPGEIPEGAPNPFGDDIPEEMKECALFVGSFDIGDLAFSKRVLDPESHDWDKMFGELAAGLEIDGIKAIESGGTVKDVMEDLNSDEENKDEE